MNVRKQQEKRKLDNQRKEVEKEKKRFQETLQRQKELTEKILQDKSAITSHAESLAKDFGNRERRIEERVKNVVESHE